MYVRVRAVTKVIGSLSRNSLRLRLDLYMILKKIENHKTYYPSSLPRFRKILLSIFLLIDFPNVFSTILTLHESTALHFRVGSSQPPLPPSKILPVLWSHSTQQASHPSNINDQWWFLIKKKKRSE